MRPAGMILTCPECATRYQTDAAAFLPDGRKVRCAKCGHVWHQTAPAPEPEAEFAPAEESAPPPPAPEAIIPQRSAYVPSAAGSADDAFDRLRAPARWLEHAGVALGWIGLLALVVVIGWSALHYRQIVASLWPQSSSLYAALGLKVNALGIDIVGVTYRHQAENGQDVLAISGKLVNITSHELSVPPIRVALIDEDKRVLYHWNFSPDVATLRPGQVEPFLTRLPSPPPGARRLEVRFTERGH